ncbi:MAG: alpha/beta fold hydrolase [Alphaproteobacteria bacterium]|nr:alpha/beta fold hydrolase [Alphaproteobacteria bacterium]
MTMRRHDAPHLPAFGGEAWPWRGGDLQTLRHFIRRDIPEVKGGARVVIDLDDGDRLLAEFHSPQGPAKAAIIAVHGLTGCMDSDHIKSLTHQALARNIAVMRVNMRGAGPARALARKSYNAKAGADLLPFIKAMRKAVGDDLPVVMVAHSIGGAAALNMMLDYPDQLSGLDGVVSVAAPIDMHASNKRFHSARNWLYMRHLLAGLKQLAEHVPGIAPDLLARVRRVPTITGFDEVLTAPMAGFASADDYYTGASTFHRLDAPPRPTLLIHADNDPWIPVDAYLGLPRHDQLDVMISRGGGHVGFHDGDGVWSNRVIFTWLERFIRTG